MVSPRNMTSKPMCPVCKENHARRPIGAVLSRHRQQLMLAKLEDVAKWAKIERGES